MSSHSTKSSERYVWTFDGLRLSFVSIIYHCLCFRILMFLYRILIATDGCFLAFSVPASNVMPDAPRTVQTHRAASSIIIPLNSLSSRLLHVAAQSHLFSPSNSSAQCGWSHIYPPRTRASRVRVSHLCSAAAANRTRASSPLARVPHRLLLPRRHPSPCGRAPNIRRPPRACRQRRTIHRAIAPLHAHETIGF